MKLMINCPRTILILLTSLLLVHQPAGAQKTTRQDQFRLIRTPKGYYNTHVEFIDTITNTVIKTVDLIQNNPYNKLNFSSRGTDDKGYNEYEIDKVRLKDFKLDGASFVRNKSFPDTWLIEKAGGISSHVVLANNYASNYIIIKYNFLLIQETSLLGQSSTIFIYSANGDFIKKLNSFSTQCQNACVTEDCKYLAFTYGGVADESLEYFDKVGFQIIDLIDNNVVVENRFDSLVYKTVTTCFDNLIRVTCKNTGGYRTYIIYDFQNGKKYIKDYHESILGTRKATTDSGFVFEIPPRGSDILRTDYYKTDFKVEDIK